VPRDNGKIASTDISYVA